MKWYSSFGWSYTIDKWCWIYWYKLKLFSLLHLTLGTHANFCCPFDTALKIESVVSMFPSIIDTKTRQYLQIMKLLVNWNSCLPPEEGFLNNPHMKFSESPLNQLLVDHSQPFLTSQTEWKEIKRFNLLHKPVLLWKER